MTRAQGKIKYKHTLYILFLIFFSFILLPTQSVACHECYYRNYYYCAKKVAVPVAICTAGNTNIPLPRFICCQLLDRRGEKIWGRTWVARSCKRAHPYAVYDFGCNKNSPIFGVGKPIVGYCRFYCVSGYCW